MTVVSLECLLSNKALHKRNVVSLKSYFKENKSRTWGKIQNQDKVNEK